MLFTILLLVLLYLRHFSGFVLVFSTLKAAVQLLHRMLWLDERGGLDLENITVHTCSQTVCVCMVLSFLRQ